MIDVAGYLIKAAEKSGFVRERYDVKKIPTNPSNITVLPFFGDIRSLVVLSALLLKRYREEDKGSRYFVLCSWPGYESFFPFVDEYWTLEDTSKLNKLYSHSGQFRNKSEEIANIYRSLNLFFFEDMITSEDLSAYYSNGLGDGFWKKYKEVKRFLPSVPSSAQLNRDFSKALQQRAGYKVFLYPSMYFSSWRMGDIEHVFAPKDFWIHLVKRLLDEGFMPVIYKGNFCHDLSPDLLEKCLYVSYNDMSFVMSAMRSIGFVLDIFSGISRVALAARCPFLMVDERNRYFTLKEYEVDDLCVKVLPKQYFYSFTAVITGADKTAWDFNIINGIINKMNSFVPLLDRDTWPATGESYEAVSYDSVRRKKNKSIGTRLLMVPKID